MEMRSLRKKFLGMLRAVGLVIGAACLGLVIGSTTGAADARLNWRPSVKSSVAFAEQRRLPEIVMEAEFLGAVGAFGGATAAVVVLRRRTSKAS